VQLHGPGTKQGDFVIDFDSSPGSVLLYGIESPGLTSSLAIGKLVVEKLLGKGGAISSRL
jgi:glycine/D-amino acid oxidase-like deaminating enzyme